LPEMGKSDEVYLRHILKSVELILEYTRKTSENEFYRNQEKIDAVVRNFEIIGEASKRVSDDLKSAYPIIEWKKMAGMRDKLIHDYIDVDYAILWSTVLLFLPELKKQIGAILEADRFK